MADFILLMHGDATAEESSADWGPYLAGLRALGLFEGGSGIGEGACFRKTGAPAPVSSRIGGFIRVRAEDLDHAARLLEGNPVYEAGGTVEIRELPRDD
jgi:hypothetical protein